MGEGDHSDAPAAFLQLGFPERVDVGMTFHPVQHCATDFTLPLAMHYANVMEPRDEGRIQVLVQLDQGLFHSHLSKVYLNGRRVKRADQECSPAASLALSQSLAPAHTFYSGGATGEAAVGLGRLHGQG